MFTGRVIVSFAPAPGFDSIVTASERIGSIGIAREGTAALAASADTYARRKLDSEPD